MSFPTVRLAPRRCRSGEGVAELERRREAVLGRRLQRLGQRLLDRRGDVGAQLPDGDRLAAQPRDHHFLRVAALEGELAGEHLERHDAERVDVAARIERLAADLLGTHELGRAEDDTRRGELGDRGIGAALLGETEVHDDRALGAAAVVRHEHDVLGLQVPVNDLQIVRVMKTGAHLLEQCDALADLHGAAPHFPIRQ